MTQSSQTDESVIIFASWFRCLRVLPRKQFTGAVDALLGYALLGEPIESAPIPESVKAILLTFAPVIMTHRLKRQAGAKGAQYGALGGRPKTPKGISADTPMVSCETGNGTDATGTDSGAVCGDVTAASSPHTDVDFFLPVFWGRNLQHPRRQAERFVAHYGTTGWTLGGGEYLASDQQRLAAAQRWKVSDDPGGRFSSDDLAFLGCLAEAAPPDIRSALYDDRVEIHRAEVVENKEVRKKLLLRIPTQAKVWLMTESSVRPVVDTWRGDQSLSISTF